MPAYTVINLDVTDPDMFNQYREQATPLVLAKGGKFLVIDFEPKDMHGQSRLGLAIIEWESVQAAEAYYNSPEYQQLVGLRLGSTEGWIRIAPAFTMPAA
jgi:uncharacterized protein (DUF1330 family)